MNQEISKNIDVYIDSRLKKWGAWCERCMTSGLGYPKSSAFTRIRSDNYERNSVNIITSSDEEDALTDEAICKLSKYKIKLADIIRINYISGGSLKEKSKRMGVSYDSFKKQLILARAWVSGFIIDR